MTAACLQVAIMKCQRCSRQATLHITEVTGEDQFEEHHLCEECAQKYMYEPQAKALGLKGAEGAGFETEETIALNQRECPACGLKFSEFREKGRLGCPHDYDAFKDALAPLLENIHGDTRHRGKSPGRQPQVRQAQAELTKLRKQLQHAITKENYEEAAHLRDQIKQVEEA